MTEEIKEILNKSDPTTDEMIKTIQYYIKERKNVDVNINIYKNINTEIPSVFIAPLLQKEVGLLHNAFNHVIGYYANKDNKI